LTQYNVSIVIK